MVRMSVKARMFLLVAVALAVSVVIAINSSIGMARMSALQHEGHQRTEDAILAQKGAGMATKLYQIVADTVINRNMDDAAAEWDDAKRALAEVLHGLDAVADTDDERRWLAQARGDSRELIELYEQQVVPAVRQMLRVGDDEGAEARGMARIRGLDGEIDRLVAALEADLIKVSEAMIKEALEADEEFDAASAATLYRNVALSLAGLGMLVVVATWITRDLLRELGGEPAYAAEIAERIADGDLSFTVKARAGDAHSLLASIGRMQRALVALIGGIQDSAAKVSSAAVQLSAAARQVMEASQQQSDSASSMAAAVEQMTVSIGQVADGAAEADRTAAESGGLAVQGAQVVQSAASEIHVIADSVGRTGELMETLGKQTAQITMVVNVIREIADQTNLLALNAAIEAARAGEQGRGFAVVADEVRKLAERTATSTKEIGAMVDSIQRSTEEALESMVAGRVRVETGVALASDAGAAITKVQSSADKVVGAVADIANALQEQRIASTQIAQSVERIALMTEESNAATGQIADATAHLDELAQSLEEMTQRFRLRQAAQGA